MFRIFGCIHLQIKFLVSIQSRILIMLGRFFTCYTSMQGGGKIRSQKHEHKYKEKSDPTGEQRTFTFN